MKIPSYDDLEPSIPDISPGDVFASVERLLPAAAPVALGAIRAGGFTGKSQGLYAALRGASMDALMAIARDFSPRVERYGDRDVVIDVSGLGRLIGDAHAIGTELARAGAEQVAVVTSQIGARLLARARPGVSVETEHVERALGVIPLAVLQQLTVDDRSVASAFGRTSPFDVLHRWGLRTLGELGALPAAELSARLGPRGLALQRLARGIDLRPLIPDPGVTRFVESMELEWPIEMLEPLSFVFARLLDALAAALERADRGAVAVHLDLRLTDRSTHARLLQLPAAMRDPRVLRTLLLLDLESHPPPAAIDIVTIEVDPAPARIIQYSLLERALPSAETIVTLNARLDALVGGDRCGSPVLLETHRSDAFEMKAFGRFAGSPEASSCSRPSVLRRFRPPIAVRVTLERGRPVRLAIDRQGMPGGRVTQAAGPWRTSGAWWDGKPWDRDEWDITCSDGAACRIYRDRRSAVWFFEGIFD